MTFDACTDNIQAAKVNLPAVLGKHQQGPAAALHAAGLPFWPAYLAEREVSSAVSAHLPVTSHIRPCRQLDSPPADFVLPGQCADRQLCSVSACCAAWQGSGLTGGLQQAV